VATRCARLRRAGDRHGDHLVATRCARLRRAGDRHWDHLVATRCARLRRAGESPRGDLVATRCARLRRAGDRHGVIWWRPAAPGFAALAIATPVVVDREVGEA
jgi:hypothetical protein